MQYFIDNFNPLEYEDIAKLSRNDSVTLMLHSESKQQIVRKRISGNNRELYRQLVHIRHKNLVQVFGLEENEDCCYTYEEYIDGTALDEISEPVSEEQAAAWIRQLCGAVRVLHEQKPVIIHRDIKPGNIMLTSNGVIKLIDFDAAKGFLHGKSRDTELIGTPDYAAPEQYGFAPSDPRTDIYAIGVLFHELITGHKPNEGKSRYNGRYKRVIQNCVEFDPQKRYRRVRELERRFEIHMATGFMGKIPGFRTGVWWKKVIASIVYIASLTFTIASFCTEWESSGNIMNSLAFPGFLIISCVPQYMLITNFLQIRDKLPLLRSRLIKVKTWGIVLYLFAWLLLVILYLELFAV